VPPEQLVLLVPPDPKAIQEIQVLLVQIQLYLVQLVQQDPKAIQEIQVLLVQIQLYLEPLVQQVLQAKPAQLDQMEPLG
jgi:hypothetical protein